MEVAILGDGLLVTDEWRLGDAERKEGMQTVWRTYSKDIVVGLFPAFN